MGPKGPVRPETAHPTEQALPEPRPAMASVQPEGTASEEQAEGGGDAASGQSAEEGARPGSMHCEDFAFEGHGSPKSGAPRSEGRAVSEQGEELDLEDHKAAVSLQHALYKELLHRSPSYAATTSEGRRNWFNLARITMCLR